MLNLPANPATSKLVFSDGHWCHQTIFWPFSAQSSGHMKFGCLIVALLDPFLANLSQFRALFRCETQNSPWFSDPFIRFLPPAPIENYFICSQEFITREESNKHLVFSRTRTLSVVLDFVDFWGPNCILKTINKKTWKRREMFVSKCSQFPRGEATY